jgi:hypothetical protein
MAMLAVGIVLIEAAKLGYLEVKNIDVYLKPDLFSREIDVLEKFE